MERAIKMMLVLAWNTGLPGDDIKQLRAASESGIPRLPPTNVSMFRWLSIYIEKSSRQSWWIYYY